MGFVRDRAVNLLNLHYGVYSIALNGGAAFLYLLNSGVPIRGVRVSLALILMARVVIRPIVVGFAVRWAPAGDGCGRYDVERPAISSFG
jgi:hypothetical protein